MKSYREIHLSYLESDGYLSGRESMAKTAARKTRWATLRKFNDHAYFVMLFAQLEQHVTDPCQKLVSSRQAKLKWALRRPWDSLDVDRMDFMRRVSVLTDKGQATYARVKHYYTIRNEIAHGESATVGPLLLPVIAVELRALAKAMKAK